jgi:hypothetical protein
MIGGKNYYSSHLAWLYVYGNFPIHPLKYLDGDKKNNKIINIYEDPKVNRDVDLTQEYLKSIIDYNPDTGDFLWLRNKGGVSFNSLATNKNKYGYIRISINYKRYLAHHLAWLYIYGYLPDKTVQIDHINHNRSDNRINNLRLILPEDNQRNMKLSIKNTTGVCGVRKVGDKWTATIRTGGRTIHLGTYSTLEDASDARKKADMIYGFHENHGKIV